jgi:hypothetical protein
VGVLVALALSGCGNGNCSGVYNCPAGGGEVLVPANLPASISAVSADPPCYIALVGPYAEGPVPVNVMGSIGAGDTVTCTVHAQLSDGSRMAAALSFRALPCCGTAAAGSATFAFIGADAAAGD